MVCLSIFFFHGLSCLIVCLFVSDIMDNLLIYD
jgi:hypothetical protein